VDRWLLFEHEDWRGVMAGFIPDDFQKAEWHSIVGDRQSWIFGVTEDKLINQKFAVVMRVGNGTWDWAIASTRFQGNEPSRALAMGEVNNLYNMAIKLSDTMTARKGKS
jgi:hypothetical protein